MRKLANYSWMCFTVFLHTVWSTAKWGFYSRVVSSNIIFCLWINYFGLFGHHLSIISLKIMLGTYSKINIKMNKVEDLIQYSGKSRPLHKRITSKVLWYWTDDPRDYPKFNQPIPWAYIDIPKAQLIKSLRGKKR